MVDDTDTEGAPGRRFACWCRWQPVLPDCITGAGRRAERCGSFRRSHRGPRGSIHAGIVWPKPLAPKLA